MERSLPMPSPCLLPAYRERVFAASASFGMNARGRQSACIASSRLPSVALRPQTRRPALHAQDAVGAADELQRTQNQHGVHGPSSIERLPTEGAITEQMTRCKGVWA